MIRLTKQPEPDILHTNACAWRTKLLEHINNGTTVPDNLKNEYNHPDVKQRLKEEAYKKCMYCESRIDHVAYEHIEHILPKSMFPELTFAWENLGLACPICNTKKGDKYDSASPFINPYTENPADHLYFFGTFLFAYLGKHRGELTIKIIELNRPALLEQRLERVKEVQRMANQYATTTEGLLKKCYKEALTEEFKYDKEYSFCVNSMREIKEMLFT